MGNNSAKEQVEMNTSKLLSSTTDFDPLFWDTFFTSNISKDLFNEMFSLEYVKKLNSEYLENFITFLKKTVEKLEMVVDKGIEDEIGVVVLNCLRVLTRLLPAFYVNYELAVMNLWNEDDEVMLGGRIVSVLTSLLFMPGFTCFLRESEDFELENCWEFGAGVSTVAHSRQFDSNRIEVLECLIACFSEPLFQDRIKFYERNNMKNHAVEYFVTNNAQYVPLVLFSLINVIGQYDPVGWGLPYNHVIFRDIREELLNCASHFLSIILDYQYSDVSEVDTGNLYVAFFSELDSDNDFAFIFKRFCYLVDNPANSDNTYLPSSMKHLESHQQLVFILWRMWQINSKFLNFVTYQPDIINVVYSMATYLNNGRKDIAQLGFVHLLTFVFLFLSSSREFVIQLNQPFNEYRSKDIPKFSGNFADYLYLVLMNLIRDSDRSLRSLWECALITLTNISPYIKSFSKVTGSRLVSLFKTFTSKKFLLRKEKNGRYFHYIIEIINNILQYQYAGNSPLLYSLILCSDAFLGLREMSFEGVEGTIEPDEEWLTNFRSSLKIETVEMFLRATLPRLKHITDQDHDENAIFSYLGNTTTVGILPVPHPILIRNYQPNLQTTERFNQFLWGIVFLQHFPSIFDAKNIILFQTEV